MKMKLTINIGTVAGLGPEEQAMLIDLVNVYQNHKWKNSLKERFYTGHIPLSEVNLGIALPEGMQGLEIGCAWGAKTVDVLAGRSMFDGFVDLSGEPNAQLDAIVKSNNLIAEYMKACRDELKTVQDAK